MCEKFLNFRSGSSLIVMMVGSFLLVQQCGAKTIPAMLLIIISLMFHVKYSLNDEFDRIVSEMKRETHQNFLKACNDMRKELDEKYKQTSTNQHGILEELLKKTAIEDG